MSSPLSNHSTNSGQNYADRSELDSSTSPHQDDSSSGYGRASQVSKQRIEGGGANTSVATDMLSVGSGQTLSDKQIRLLDLLPGGRDEVIECAVRVVSLDTSGIYEALSYVWGEQSGSTPIKVASREVKVTKNLHAALRQLRHATDTRTLWIDQLCINQWDIKERAKQVHLMRLVYKRCSQSLVWLGEIPTAPDISYRLRCIRRSSRPLVHSRYGRNHPSPYLDDPELHGPWTRSRCRTKGIQSRVLGGKYVVVPDLDGARGHSPTFCNRTLGAVDHPLRQPDRSGRQHVFPNAELYIPEPVNEAIDRHSHLIKFFLGPFRGLDISRKGESPLYVVQRWRYRDATQASDKLYALVGLFKTIPGVECNYEIPQDEVFTRMTLGLIEWEAV